MKLFLSAAFAAGLMIAGAASASAAVMAPPAPGAHNGSITLVRDGCGRGYHENRWGRCVRNDDEGWGRGRGRGDGCGRYMHRNRWGRCVRNW
ncbi:MAG: hypothetical protein JO348_14820 [Alphaproteobacteria bacterium]|nr:hypothetical protein [Alphaproteobacteria bacterium]MBV9421038.1 hypothetical protein [Alphaproteobacteria bacterium]